MLTRDEVRTRLADILGEVAGVNPDDVVDEATFRDALDVDSLSMVEVAVSVEARFGVAIPDEAIDGFKTVGDLVDYVQRAAA